jgi:prophage tail gpP-like protein
MAITHDVTLEIGGKSIDVWDEYQIKQSMVDHGSPFTFTLWHSLEAQSAWDWVLQNVKCEDKATVRIDGALQLCGVIETIKGSADKSGGAKLVVSGTDVAGLTMRWDTSPRVSQKTVALSDAVTAIFADFGLSVQVADATAMVSTQTGRRRGGRGAAGAHRGQRIDKYRPEIGEKAWTAADRLCRRAGYMLWTAPWDVDTIAVIIDKPRYDSAPQYQFTRRIENGRATQDSNIISGGPCVTTAECPSEVYVYGHGDRGDGTPARVCGHAKNDRWDPQFVRTPVRTKEIHQRTQKSRGLHQSEKQASRVVDQAMVRHSTYECVVQGHSQGLEGGDDIQLMYAINNVARVRDDIFARDQSMMIDTVEFSRSRGQGTLTHVTMHALHAIQLEPDPEA